MWVFLSGAFISIVKDKDDPLRRVVRARLRGDIERVFGKVKVVETPFADYRFRAFVPRQLVADTLSECALDIDYVNFKNSVPDKPRHDAYLRVWQVMVNEQHRRIDEEFEERERMAEANKAPPKTQARLGRVLKTGALYVNPRGKTGSRPR